MALHCIAVDEALAEHCMCRYLLHSRVLLQILNFVRVAVQSRKVNLLNIDSKVTDSIWYELPVDTKLQEVTVSMSGNGAKVIVKDPNGTHTATFSRIGTLVWNRYFNVFAAGFCVWRFVKNNGCKIQHWRFIFSQSAMINDKESCKFTFVFGWMFSPVFACFQDWSKFQFTN